MHTPRVLDERQGLGLGRIFPILRESSQLPLGCSSAQVTSPAPAPETQGEPSRCSDPAALDGLTQGFRGWSNNSSLLPPFLVPTHSPRGPSSKWGRWSTALGRLCPFLSPQEEASVEMCVELP